MGIQGTVVRDTVTVDGELVEDTYDWYAQDEAGNVYRQEFYAGEAEDLAEVVRVGVSETVSFGSFDEVVSFQPGG